MSANVIKCNVIKSINTMTALLSIRLQKFYAS